MLLTITVAKGGGGGVFVMFAMQTARKVERLSGDEAVNKTKSNMLYEYTTEIEYRSQSNAAEHVYTPEN